ncbi:hypothetical protein LINPERHAP1_LOCUS3849, partial [Linum perenne]
LAIFLCSSLPSPILFFLLSTWPKKSAILLVGCPIRLAITLLIYD